MTVIPTVEATRVSEEAMAAARRLWGQLLRWKVVSPMPQRAADAIVGYIAACIEEETANRCAGVAQEILNDLEATADEVARGYSAEEELHSLQEAWAHRRDELVERYMQLAAELGHEDDTTN